LKTSLKIALALFLLLIMIAFFAYKYIIPTPEKSLTIGAGREGGMYYQYAQKYAKNLQAQGFTIQIIKSAGSVENLALLESGKVDIAFVQGGVAKKENKEHLRSIASIYFEPLWLFYPSEHEDIHYLSDLKPLSISIGEAGSGTKELVSTLLQSTALDTNKTLQLSTKEAYSAFKRGEIEAFFTVASPDSTQILTLLRDKNLKVASLNRLKAYQKHFHYLNQYQISEGALNLQENIPNQALNLLSTPATLVVRKGLDDTFIRFITIQVKKASVEKFFPSTEYVDIPMHPEAKKYLLKGESFLEKIFPYWIASNIDNLKYLLIPILTLLLPIFKGVFPLYKWRVRSKIYKWYDDLEKLEKSSDDDKIRRLHTLLDEVNTHTDVPLPYMGELYNLKLHIDTVRRRLDEERI